VLIIYMVSYAWIGSCSQLGVYEINPHRSFLSVDIVPIAWLRGLPVRYPTDPLSALRRVPFGMGPLIRLFHPLNLKISRLYTTESGQSGTSRQKQDLNAALLNYQTAPTSIAQASIWDVSIRWPRQSNLSRLRNGQGNLQTRELRFRCEQAVFYR